MKTRNLTLASLFLAVAGLAACGGGGGAAAPAAPSVAAAPSPAPVAAPAPTPVTNPDLTTSASATYAAGSVEKGAWDVLQAERQACGFGLLQQDTRLDAANQGHANYLSRNSAEKGLFIYGHYQDKSFPYFTGVSPTDRMAASGFTFSGGDGREILDATDGGIVASPEQLGAASMRRLMATVYHLAGAMHAGRMAGAGSAAQITTTRSGVLFRDFRFGFSVASADTNYQRLGTGNIATYPCEGSTAASASWRPALEVPGPFPEVTSTTEYGTPVYFKADARSALVVTTASVVRVSTGSEVPAKLVTKANDPAGLVTSNEAFLVPTVPLVVGERYQVTAAGTLDGVAFSRGFTFVPALATAF